MSRHKRFEVKTKDFFRLITTVVQRQIDDGIQKLLKLKNVSRLEVDYIGRFNHF
jgi:hypothetical protein